MNKGVHRHIEEDDEARMEREECLCTYDTRKICLCLWLQSGIIFFLRSTDESEAEVCWASQIWENEQAAIHEEDLPYRRIRYPISEKPNFAGFGRERSQASVRNQWRQNTITPLIYSTFRVLLCYKKQCSKTSKSKPRPTTVFRSSFLQDRTRKRSWFRVPVQDKYQSSWEYYDIYFATMYRGSTMLWIGERKDVILPGENRKRDCSLCPHYRILSR